MDPKAIVRLEGLSKWKISNIGNRTRDLKLCSAVPQPTALPRALCREKCWAELARCISVHYVTFSVISFKLIFSFWDTTSTSLSRDHLLLCTPNGPFTRVVSDRDKPFSFTFPAVAVCEAKLLSLHHHALHDLTCTVGAEYVYFLILILSINLAIYWIHSKM